MKLVRNSIWFIFLLILTTGCSNIATPLSDGEMMFWKVSDSDSSVYLLGSMHFGRADFYPLPDVIEQAYQESELLGVELDMLNIDPAVMQALVLQNMLYTDGTTLRDHVSEETMNLLEEYFATKGVSLQSFGNMTAGMITMTISQLEAESAGLLPEYGIDMHFLRKAKLDGKEILEFETIQSQLDLLFNDDEELIEGLLLKTLKEAEEYEEMLNSMATIWKTGDAQAMNTLLTTYETPEEKLYIEALFGDRDAKMTATIEHLLKDNVKAFVILGAGHFVTDDGIINRLFGTRRYEIIKY